MKKLTLLIFILTSCAQMTPEEMARAKKRWVAENCNDEAAYAQGMNDAEAEKQRNVSQYSECPAKGQSSVRKSYLRGYKKVASNPLNILKDVAGLNSYECTLDAFMDTFRATSSRLGKAKSSVYKQCLAKHHKMHCDDIKCNKL